jgi:hypothetical protein
VGVLDGLAGGIAIDITRQVPLMKVVAIAGVEGSVPGLDKAGIMVPPGLGSRLVSF